MRDYIYISLFSFSLVFGVYLALLDIRFSVLLLVMYAFAPMAIKGLDLYQSTFEQLTGIEREAYPKYQYALLGLIPAFLASFASWEFMLVGGIASIVIAVAEETFRAGAFTLLKQDLDLDPALSLVTANVAWLLFHFAQRPFDLLYAFWLFLCAILFSIALTKGGLGTAVLAHILTNSLAQWIVLSAVGGSAGFDVMLLVIIIIAIFTIAMIGGMKK